MEKPKYVYVTYIETTPEKLWKALTTEEFTKKYWFGHRLESTWKDGAAVTFWNGEVANTTGKVLTYDPFKKLAYSWNSQCNEEARLSGESRVTFELEPFGDCVKLRLVHDEFAASVPEGFQNGWPAVLSSLKSLLETGKPMAIAGLTAQEAQKALNKAGAK